MDLTTFGGSTNLKTAASMSGEENYDAAAPIPDRASDRRSVSDAGTS